MYFNCEVKIPEEAGKITLNHRGETTYVEYTYDRIYSELPVFFNPQSF